MADNALRALQSAGYPVHELPAEQQEVIRGLGPDEIALLIEIKERLDAAEPDVLAHESAPVGGLLF